MTVSGSRSSRAKGPIDADPRAERRISRSGQRPRSRFAPRVEALEKILERLFVIPGINRAVGLDVILDLVPFAGSTAGAVLGAYMAWEARNLGMSKWQMTRMAGNIGVDLLLGPHPLDRRHPRLLLPVEHPQPAIIKRHLDKHHPQT